MGAMKHGASFEIIERNPNVWLAKCGRHANFTGATYEEAEDKWRRHVHDETGVAPKPMCGTEGRWMP